LRQSDLAMLSTLTTIEPNETLKELIKTGCERDPYFSRLFIRGLHGHFMGTPGDDNQFKLGEDELIYEVRTGTNRLCIPKGEIRVKIMKEAYSVSET
jgi:hypothetical protein